ncbi:MAG: CPBP family intramembrane metalloprotease [Promethearchaeota archaeon]|nr:MAG: CPBP family intramembrane metalloprotease [Candidatus Lokiarchaeota archaeon]
MDESNSPPPIKIIREPFLIRNPWFSIVMVMVFYFLFQLIPLLVYSFLVPTTFAIDHPYVIRIIEFVSLGILLLIFIPFLRIPKDNRNYRQYLKDIQLLTVTIKGVLVGLLTTMVLFILAYGSVYLSAVLSKLYYVEIKGYIILESPGVVMDPSYLFDPNAGLNVYYALTPGIMEELAFRGVILVLLLKKYSWKKAIIVDGILFGCFHLLNLLGPTIDFISGPNAGDIYLYIALIRSVGFQVIYATSLGIAWAFMFIKSKSLIPSILAHWLIDAFGGLVLIPNIGLESFAISWIYFICITLLGIGVLPAILDVLIIKGSYRGPTINPWEDWSKRDLYQV